MSSSTSFDNRFYYRRFFSSFHSNCKWCFLDNSFRMNYRSTVIKWCFLDYGFNINYWSFYSNYGNCINCTSRYHNQVLQLKLPSLQLLLCFACSLFG